MAKSNQSVERPYLKQNPFISLRDPITGKWRVVFGFAGNHFVNNQQPEEKTSKTASNRSASPLQRLMSNG
ncbi:MAG: hypothetical protein AAFQ63_00335 [Cyanobacteria bacterium J06621_11]